MKPPVYFTFKRMVLLAGRCARAFADVIGLTPARCDLMLAIEDNEMTQNELAATLSVTPPVVSRMVKALVTLGLVVKRKNDRDRRFNFIALTKRGKYALLGLYDDIIPDDIHVQFAGEDRSLGYWEQDLAAAGVTTQPPARGDMRELLLSIYRRVQKTDYTFEWFGIPYAEAKSRKPDWVDVDLSRVRLPGFDNVTEPSFGCGPGLG